MAVPLLHHDIPPVCSICQCIIDAFASPLSKSKPCYTDDIVAYGPTILEPCAGHGILFARIIKDAEEENLKEDLNCTYIRMNKYRGSSAMRFWLDRRGYGPRRGYALLRTDTEVRQPGSGLVPNRHWIDSDLPKFWKEQCLKYHGDECERPLKRYPLPNTTPTWLIDVHELRLVSGRSGLPYIALSYRWGQAAGLHLTRNSVLQFQQPFSLSALKHQIPETIRNAIEVVKLLGERYMWVDTLCISQDDSLTKSREIGLMGAIYANAIVTIIAADGEDAHYGLRGLKGLSDRRDLDLDALVIDFGKDYRLVNADIGSGEDKWACSPYFKRAWVFQEYHFSKRRLVFHNQMVRWECCCSKWQETIAHPERPDKQFSHAFGSILGEMSPTLAMYTRLIDDYNEREFTYTEDALPALTGLLTVLGQKILGGFLFGLPIMLFEAALNWDVDKGHGPREMTRRLPTPNKNRDSQPCLPSWSWIGWEGRIHLDYTDDDFDFCATGHRRSNLYHTDHEMVHSRVSNGTKATR